MSRLVFLLEEDSMRDLLNGLLPRLFPGLPFQCVPHEGKRDLEKSIPRKLRVSWDPDVRFVVMRDQDSADCRQVKAKLTTLCQGAKRPDALVRVVCQELEAWYIGDAKALAQAFPENGKKILREMNKSRYRDPDAVVQPSEAIARHIPAFQKRSGARRMAAVLSQNNASRSFRVFLAGVERLWREMRSGERVGRRN